MEQNRLKVNPIESAPVKGRGMNKIIIVTRKTRLTELVIKYNTLEQAKFYIEHLGADFSDYVLEDENYRKAVEIVKSIAEKYARVQEVDRTFFPNMILGWKGISCVDKPIGWSEDNLTFVVREPYKSKSTQADIVYGKLGKKDTFRIVSKMAVNGVLFSDSMESDAIESMREAMHGKQSCFLLP